MWRRAQGSESALGREARATSVTAGHRRAVTTSKRSARLLIPTLGFLREPVFPPLRKK